MEENKKVVLVLCDDLIFGSRISGEASAAGLDTKTFKTVEKLLDAATKLQFVGVLIDLGIIPNSLELLISGIREKSGMAVPILGYGSHVDVELLKKARAAGYDPVLPRSKFVTDLPSILLSFANNNC